MPLTMSFSSTLLAYDNAVENMTWIYDRKPVSNLGSCSTQCYGCRKWSLPLKHPASVDLGMIMNLLKQKREACLHRCVGCQHAGSSGRCCPVCNTSSHCRESGREEAAPIRCHNCNTKKMFDADVLPRSLACPQASLRCRYIPASSPKRMSPDPGMASSKLLELSTAALTTATHVQRFQN